MLQYIDHDNAGHVDPKKIMQMIGNMPKKPFEILTIHDCFRCLPNYGNDLRMQYNRVLSELAGSNLLANIVSQLVGKPITVRKYGDLSNAILESNYALS